MCIVREVDEPFISSGYWEPCFNIENVVNVQSQRGHLLTPPPSPPPTKPKPFDWWLKGIKIP